MAVLSYLFFGILICQIYVNAAPSDEGKLDEIANVKAAGKKLDPIKEVEDSASSVETVREKRFYDPFGYGLPPINPVYSSFNKRDDFANSGNFGVEDPLAQIHRHVQEIANFVRQPQPPRLPQVPLFYPVLFVPYFDCNCNTNNNQPTDQPTDQSTDVPIDRPTEPSTEQPGDQTNYPVTSNVDPPEKTNLTSRFSETDDERRNWGFFINRTGENRTPNQGRPEFSRPISFDPIRLNQPTSRPSPPVEHGTLQSDVTENEAPSRPQNDRSSSTMNSRPPPASTARPTILPQNPPRPQNGYPITPPTACDAAILACCHRPLIVYDCFAIQGCTNINTYGNPCETSSILRIIERLQRFYASRSG